MRHISQQLRDVLLSGDAAGEEVIQSACVEFKSTRIGKYKQDSKEVMKEFQKIALAALDFEDAHQDNELKFQDDEAGELKKADKKCS